MTKTKKIMAISLLCALPLAGFAYEGYKGHDKDNSSCGKHQENSHFFSHEDDDYDYFEKKGANLVFEGKIEKKPVKGFNGTWKISGKELIVNDETTIYMDEKIEKNDKVEVIAKRENGKIIALLLEHD